MVVEAGVAIGAGIAARSITLLAFGIDGVIELASAGVLIWRILIFCGIFVLAVIVYIVVRGAGTQKFIDCAASSPPGYHIPIRRRPRTRSALPSRSPASKAHGAT